MNTEKLSPKRIFFKQYKPGSSRTSSRKKLKSFEFEMSVNFVCKCLQFIVTLSGNNEGFIFIFAKVDLVLLILLTFVKCVILF